MSVKNNKIVIVGAGVTGCSIAYHLAKLGVSSTLVDKDSIAARASGKAWAAITYPLTNLLVEKDPSTHLHADSEVGVKNWLDILSSGYYRLRDISIDIREKTGIDIGYDELFMTAVANNEEEVSIFKEELALYRPFGGTEIEYLDRDELRALYQGINPDFSGGLKWPGVQLEPYKYTLGLAQAAEKLAGVQVRQGEVVGFGTKGGSVTSVKLASGKQIEADTVIITMGPWSGQGASFLGRNIPMGPVLEQCLRLETSIPVSRHMVLNGLAGFLPKPTGDYIMGISSQTGVPFCDENAQVRLEAKAKYEILEALLNIYPDMVDAKVVEHRADYMSFSPRSPNHKPALGRMPEYDNAYIAARIPLGMMMSAGVGRVMSEYVLTGEPPVHYKRALDFLKPTEAV